MEARGGTLTRVEADLASRRGCLKREEFLKLITAWDGARMLVHRVSTTCDAKAIDHDGCLGFDRFSNTQLKRMFPLVFKPEDEITQW